MMRNQVQQDLQQHKLSGGGMGPAGWAPSSPIMSHGVQVADAVDQLQIELQAVHSRLCSDAASIGGPVFE
jgi:hypothetical protein